MGVFWGYYATILKTEDYMRATILKSLLDQIVFFNFQKRVIKLEHLFDEQ